MHLYDIRHAVAAKRSPSVHVTTLHASPSPQEATPALASPPSNSSSLSYLPPPPGGVSGDGCGCGWGVGSGLPPLPIPLGSVKGGACFAADSERLVWGGAGSGGRGGGRAFNISHRHLSDGGGPRCGDRGARGGGLDGHGLDASLGEPRGGGSGGGGGGGSARYAWRRRYAAELEAASGVARSEGGESGGVSWGEALNESSPTPKTRVRRPRGTKKQWSH